MPRSPRWYDGRLWVLHSGHGELGVVDLQQQQYQAVESMPGYTRGLAFHGPIAFVGIRKRNDVVVCRDSLGRLHFNLPFSLGRVMPAHSATNRESFWRELIARRESLGLSVNEACREADVSPSSFYHLQQKLRVERRPGTVNAPPAVPLVPVRIVDDRVMELRLELADTKHGPTVRHRFLNRCNVPCETGKV